MSWENSADSATKEYDLATQTRKHISLYRTTLGKIKFNHHLHHRALKI